MFTGFTKETSDFLWELSFHNERPWFLEHKEQFERCLNQPFKELARETYALLCRRFPGLECNVHVSRIYRDARRLFGRGPYKDHLWFSIQCGDHNRGGPSFWFEIGAAEYTYGLGFWSERPADMELYRRAIDANPARFERLVKPFAGAKDLRLFGQEYRRPKGDRGEILNPWYNRRSVGLESVHDFGGDLLTPELPQILVDCYAKLMPLHDFFLEVRRASDAAGSEEPHG